MNKTTKKEIIVKIIAAIFKSLSRKLLMRQFGLDPAMASDPLFLLVDEVGFEKEVCGR